MKIFLHSVGCLFAFLMVSFEAQKDHHLDEARFIDFVACTLMSYLRNHCLTERHKYSSMFSSMRFIVLTLTFKSFIHFELFLVCGEWYESKFMVLNVDIQLSQHHGLKRLCACMLSCFSHVWLSVTLWTVALQAPLSMGFSRQVY